MTSPPSKDAPALSDAPKQCGGWLQRANITVEPVMLVHMLAFMLTSVVGQSFLVHRACRVHLGLPETVCSSIQEPQYKNESARVQVRLHMQNHRTLSVRTAKPIHSREI